jgi:hypothetical protein
MKKLVLVINFYNRLLFSKGATHEEAIPKGPFMKGYVPSRIGTLSLLYIYKKWSKPSINTINHSILL